MCHAYTEEDRPKALEALLRRLGAGDPSAVDDEARRVAEAYVEQSFAVQTPIIRNAQVGEIFDPVSVIMFNRGRLWFTAFESRSSEIARQLGDLSGYKLEEARAWQKVKFK